MRWFNYFLWVWVPVILFNDANGQQLSMLKDLRVEHITQEQGLSSSNVYKIMQDDKGFIWIITSAGLNRYDG